MGIVINAEARFRRIGAIPLKEENVLFDPVAFYKKCVARHKYDSALAAQRREPRKSGLNDSIGKVGSLPVDSDYGGLRD